MTLLERLACRVVGCQRAHERDTDVCADHLNDLWANRLERLPDGRYQPKRRFVPADLTGVAA